MSVKGRGTRLTEIWKGQLGAQLFVWGIARNQGQKLRMSQNGMGTTGVGCPKGCARAKRTSGCPNNPGIEWLQDQEQG